jgi:hypothetical protein
MTLARATDNVDAVSIMFFLFMEERVGPRTLGQKKIHFSRRSRVFANSGGREKRGKGGEKEGKEEKREGRRITVAA